MRALLDTNVIIHRENTKATSFTIGKLFYWLDKLRYEKLIHPYSIAELRKYRNPQMQSLYDAKIDAYTEMRCIAPQTAEFTALLSDTPKTANDQIDNQLLCELYCKRADILITEDRCMRLKADRLGLSERVFFDDVWSQTDADKCKIYDYSDYAAIPAQDAKELQVGLDSAVDKG